MRLFIATPVTLPFYQNIQKDLNPYIKGKWVESYNLHLTHKFIGIDDPDNWKFDLKIPNEKIEIKNFGMFNNKILYMKANSPNIDFIAKQLNVKNFIPHITLCRLKTYKKEILNYLQNVTFSHKIEFKVCLYSSILTKKGPIYKKLYTY